MSPHKDKNMMPNNIETITFCLCIFFNLLPRIQKSEAEIHVSKLIKTSPAADSRVCTHLLVLEGLAQLDVVGEGPHCDGQLSDDFQIDGPSVCRGDEGVHPPVGGLGQQVDERLQKTNAEVLEVFWGLHLGRVGETHIALLTKYRTQPQ